MKKIFFSVIILIILIASLELGSPILAQTCPSNTIAEERQATLVGEITNDGGDPNLGVWFQYGRSSSYGYESSGSSRHGTGLFCVTIHNLEPCTTYHYRAAARNSAGSSFGENKTFTTRCVPVVTVDLRANGSDSPIALSYRDSATLSWTSRNAAFCEASGDWSGTKATSGSETIRLASIRTHTFNITCRDAAGIRTTADSIQVTVRPRPPAVITIPAIVTR